MSKLTMMVIALWLMAVPAMAGDNDMAAKSDAQWFVVHLRHHADVAEDDAAMGAAMMGHIEYMNVLYDKGILYMAGPFTDDSGLGAGVVMAASAAEIRASLEQDPGYKAGVFTIEAIHPWMPFFNRPMNQRMTVEDFKKMMAAGMPMEGGSAPSAHSSDMATGDSGGMMEPKPGRIGFIEFGATDLAGMKKFYGTVFGWEIESAPGMDTMLFFTDTGGMTGGFSLDMAPSAAGPVCYIECSGIAATLARIEGAGGVTVMPAMALPMEGAGYIAQFMDPQGNKQGLWSMDP